VNVLSATDGALDGGTVALYSFSNNPGFYDDVQVELLGGGEYQAPVISSVTATPAELSNGETSQLAVVLATVPAQASSGQLSFQWSVGAGDGSLSDTSLPTPVYTAPAVSSTRTVTLAVTVSDGTSNVVGSVDLIVSPAATLTDDFNDGSFDGWTVVDQGIEYGPSQWAVESGVVTQRSTIRTQGQFPVNPGTFLRYDGGYGWGDYRLSARIRSDHSNPLGLLFRLQNDDNYYQFMWAGSAALQRITKVVNGVGTVLAQRNNVAYEAGRWYDIEIRVQGEQIDVFVDDVNVLSATDGALDGGTVALYSFSNNPGFYDDVQVSGL
jgi:hypothetical protein